MSAPRQKISCHCQVCRLAIDDLAAHQVGPTGRRVVGSRRGRGRPPLRPAHPQQVIQPILFTARLLGHLRQYGKHFGWAGIEKHLTDNGLDAWVPYVRLVGPYLRFRGSWGDARRGNARMWREEAVWQAARRVVGALLGLKPRTLRLRLEELDHFGERIRADGGRTQIEARLE